MARASAFLPGCAAAAVLLTALVEPARAAPLEERLGPLVEARMAVDGVPGAVIVRLRGGEPVWTRAFGLADPAADRPMTADALFRAESISKPVTAWGVIRLAEAGGIDLDAPVGACLRRWRPPPGTPPFTPRQLLSHSAGLGIGDFAARYPPEAPRPDLPAHLATDFALVAAPGAGFAYSDTGYNLLELVLEDCAGADFAAFMAREVLAPLAMHNASYDWTGAPMPVGHDLKGRPVAPYVYPGRGSGGLHATAADVARFAAASMDGANQAVLSAEGLATLHMPAVRVGGLFGVVAEGYGLGHFTETLSDGRRAVWHGGQGYGWMTHLHIVPETGDGIVILANSQRAWPLFAVILRAWSESLGVAPVGMSRVLWAAPLARGAIFLLAGVAALAGWGLLRGARRRRAVRVATGFAGAGLLVAVAWAARQDYLFIFSILPGLSAWLGGAMALAGAALAGVALWPARGR